MTGPPPPSMSPDGTQGASSSATGISGCATSPPARSASSRPTARRTSATRRATPAGRRARRASLSWSPDGKKIATQQQDERKVGDMYLVETPVNGGHPVLRAWKYPLPGDPDVAMISRVDHRRRHRQDDAPADGAGFPPRDVRRQHRHGRVPLEPGRHALGFVSTDRFHKNSTAKLADVTTGEVRTLFTETEKTHVQTRVQWQILWDTQRSALVLAARRHRADVSLRSQDRSAEEPDHERRRADHAASPGSIAPRGRCGTRRSARRRDRIRTSRTSTRSGSTARTTSR